MAYGLLLPMKGSMLSTGPIKGLSLWWWISRPSRHQQQQGKHRTPLCNVWRI